MAGRRLSRSLFTGFAALALSACLGVGVLWVRSYRVLDAFSVKRQGTSVTVSSKRRQVELRVAHCSEAPVNEDFPVRDTETHPLKHRALPLSHLAGPAGRPRAPAGRGTTHEWAGFGFGFGFKAGRPAPPLGRLPGTSAPFWAVTVPHWFAALAAAIPPAFWVLATGRRWRRRRRRRLGRCPGCGYDRRATAAGDRCPECGDHPAGPAAPARTVGTARTARHALRVSAFCCAAVLFVLSAVGATWVMIDRIGRRPPPPAPSALTASPSAPGRVLLRWVGSAAGDAHYLIERSPAGTDRWERAGTTEVGATAFEDRRLPDDTAFDYRVRAYNGFGDSPPSNTAAVKTNPPLPGEYRPPTNDEPDAGTEAYGGPGYPT